MTVTQEAQAEVRLYLQSVHALREYKKRPLTAYTWARALDRIADIEGIVRYTESAVLRSRCWESLGKFDAFRMAHADVIAGFDMDDMDELLDQALSA